MDYHEKEVLEHAASMVIAEERANGEKYDRKDAVRRMHHHLATTVEQLPKEMQGPQMCPIGPVIDHCIREHLLSVLEQRREGAALGLDPMNIPEVDLHRSA